MASSGQRTGVSSAVMELTQEPHPLLDARVFVTRFQPNLDSFAKRTPLADPPESPWPPPDDALRARIRDLLRHAGWKPTGRAKPASEYLVRARNEGGLRPINYAVDVCNIVSLYSGLPISVVDLDLLATPVSIGVAPPGSSYIFNPAGQTIDVGNLICLQDQHGPCANAVKDAQRTKTSDQTCSTLTVIWSHRELSDYTTDVLAFYQQLLAGAGGIEIDNVSLSSEA